MRTRTKVMAAMVLLVLVAVLTPLIWKHPAASAPPPTTTAPKPVTFAEMKPDLPVLVAPPEKVPTSHTIALPGPVVPVTTAPGVSEADTVALREMAGQIARLIEAGDFDGMAQYMEPEPAKEAKQSLEWEQAGPHGAVWLQMLARAFESFQDQTPMPLSTPDRVYFQDTTMLGAITYPRYNFTPEELATLNTINVIFYQKDGQWYLARDSFGMLVNATRRAPLPEGTTTATASP